MAQPTLEELAAGLLQLNETVAAISGNLSLTDYRGPGTWGLGLIPGASDVNQGFTLLSGYLVFFMQAGFAMLSAGSVRAKNAKNIILLNLLDACFGCIGWYITGYAFAFGDPTPDRNGVYPYKNPFIGHRYFAQHGLPRGLGLPPAGVNYVQWFFQFTFAATSATIVSGAVAERCKFECYVAYNLMLVMFVYPVVAHWVWSPMGWMSANRNPATASGGYLLLFGSGVYDFAGDGPVHMVGGLASLVAAWVLGPRIGRFDSAGNPVDMPGHNAALTLLGVFLLWFGWYGFNPGSTNAILGPFVGFSGISASIAVNTTISAAAGTLSTLLAAMLHNYVTLGVVVWDLIIAGNGALAGLVSITGPCAFVETWAALTIGFLGGIVYYAASKFILLKLKVDDPLDAIAVHGVCGAWGMLGGAAFAKEALVMAWYGAYPGTVEGRRAYGFVMGGDGKLLAAHVVYILVIAAWVCGIMTPFFLLLKRLGCMRVPPEVETLGLDISYHGGSSYPHERAHSSGWEAPRGVQVFTRDMAEKLLEEGLSALEQRLQLQFANGGSNGGTMHSRKGYAHDADPTVGAATQPPPPIPPAVGVGVGVGLGLAQQQPLANGGAAGPHGLPLERLPRHLELPSYPLGTDGFHRPSHALKPLIEGEHEGEDSSSRRGERTGTPAFLPPGAASVDGSNPMLPEQAQQAHQAQHHAMADGGSRSGTPDSRQEPQPQAGGGVGALQGTLSNLQRRVQAAYLSASDDEDA